ncbi:MAG: prephenate dehydrogenase/arogenate dehydrogenase family protein, partial [Pseudomonadales bacterium]
LVVLGVGLMGGSLALAAKKAGVVGTVVGWSRTEATLQTALANGVIDSAELDLAAALKGADCVVVATPTILAETIMIQALELLPSTVAVTDVASVKGNIADALTGHFDKVPSNAILGHPIAGSEQSGVSAAKEDLYQNHRVILINDPASSPQTDPALLAKVSQLWQAVGAEVFEMSVSEHDHVLALTSHLPHLLAYALVAQLSNHNENVNVFNFAAGGLRDFTRIASSDPRMWREILLANKTQLSSSIDDFEQWIAQLRTMLDSNDGDALEMVFSDVKNSRDNFVAELAERTKK